MIFDMACTGILCLMVSFIAMSLRFCDGASAHVPIHISVIFAGSLPIFMQDENWKADKESMQTLSELLTYAAQESNSHEVVDSTRAIHYEYFLDVHLVSDNQTSALSDTLVSSLDQSENPLLDGPEIADKYAQILQPLIQSMRKQESDVHAHVFLLLHDSVKLGDRTGFSYGYVAGNDSNVVETGIACNERLIFLDTAARPLLLEDKYGSSISEELMTVSSDISTYAEKLGRFARDLFTPRCSLGMMPFPPEDTLVFDFIVVDAGDVTASMQTSDKLSDNSGRKSVMTSFVAEQFQRFLTDAFEHQTRRPKMKVVRHDVDLSQNIALTTIVLRALRRSGLHIILESDSLIRDLTQNSILAENSLFDVHLDSSFVAHIPIFLFSFADKSRTVHFSDGERARTNIVDKQGIVILENRLKSRFEDRQDVTTLAIKGVLQLLGGVSEDIVSMVDTTRDSAPVLLKDIIRRQMVDMKLRWSQKNAVLPAEDLLQQKYTTAHNLHKQESELHMVANRTNSVLQAVLLAWNVTISNLDPALLDDTTLRLEAAVTELRGLLYDSLCSTLYFNTEKLNKLPKAQGVLRRAIIMISFVGCYILLPGLIGCLVGYFSVLNRCNAIGETFRSEYRQDRCTVGAGTNNEPVWFSTLSEKFIRKRQKPKLN